MLDRNMTTAHADTATTDAQESSPRYAGWRVVLACYLAAVFCWGFGLYGHGVYLTELHRLHGWPNALISAAVLGRILITDDACLPQSVEDGEIPWNKNGLFFITKRS
jgi:hypothetical protein